MSASGKTTKAGISRCHHGNVIESGNRLRFPKCGCRISSPLVCSTHRADLPSFSHVEFHAKMAADYAACANDLMRVGLDRFAFRTARMSYRQAVYHAEKAAELAPTGSGWRFSDKPREQRA